MPRKKAVATFDQPVAIEAPWNGILRASFDQNLFNSKLTLVGRAVATKPTIPVLVNVLLQADASRQEITLTGFDISLCIKATLSANVEKTGSILLPYKLLHDIVGRLDGNLTLEVSNELQTRITASGGHYNIKGMDVIEYPELSEFSKNNEFVLPADALKEGLAGTLFATSDDESKQLLTGVHLKMVDGLIEFAATDGHRLALVTKTFEGKAVDLDLTVPSKALQEVSRMIGMLKSKTPDVQIAFNHTLVRFICEDHEITSRLIEGQYPNYRQLMPRAFATRMNCDKKQLLAILDRIAIVAEFKNKVVKLRIDPVAQKVTIFAEAADVGDGKETMTAQITGPDTLEIAFNVKYAIDAIRVVNSSEVALNINTAISPATFTELGASSYTCLVMPVQVKDQ